MLITQLKFLVIIYLIFVILPDYGLAQFKQWGADTDTPSTTSRGSAKPAAAPKAPRFSITPPSTTGSFDLKPFSIEPKMPGSLDLTPSSEFSILDKAKRGYGTGEDQCPKSYREALKIAKTDAIKFKRSRPFATWSTFLYDFRHKYSSCSAFLKRAYVETARDILQPKKRAMFQR